MKKKVSSSLLMASMLAVGSTGMLVSCSEDYDDDIKNLQSQIDGLATADELNSRINEMSSAIEQAKNEAIEKANAANEVALAAQQAAANAANTAEGAQQVADAAMAKAEELEKNGATKAEVEAAQEAAAAAQAFAEQAKADAEKALADLQAALDAAVTAAQDAVTKAQATADDAKATADDAKAAAEKAFEDAKALIEKAEENAAEQAGEAMTKATEALDAALKAQSTAEQGVADAATALAAANAAAGDAQKAQQAAETAQQAAEAAQATADEAKKLANDALSKISDLESKLNTAISNGATKEELTNAINDAKSTLNQAIKDAEKRATDAANAAKTAADAAQADATEALNLAKAAQTSINNIESQINSEKTGLAALDARLSIVETWMKGGEAEGLQVDLKAVEEKLDSIDGALKEIVGEYSSMVTSVSFYVSDALSADLDQKFSKVTQKANTFPKEDVADGKLTFKEGYTTTDSVDVIVRVSPTNAVLKAENISLINSQGVEINDIVKCTKVEAYNSLLTRATTGNGLWKLTFKMVEGTDPDDFKSAVESNGQSVLFAVAVKNTELSGDDRRVVTGYDLTLSAEDAPIAGPGFALLDNAGDWKDIADIHNRYSESEEDGTSTSDIVELVWNDNTKPATAATDKNSSNRGNNGFDNRDDKPLLSAEVGKPIEIVVDATIKDNKATVKNKIAGFYVTLDDKFAVTSAPSEINAWNSYSYEGVGKGGSNAQKATLFKGNKGQIAIKDLGNVAGDVIGFRLYAVNLDGTLLDPDGRAFYVAVGNVSTQATLATATAELSSTGTTFTSGKIEVPAGTFANYTGKVEQEYVSGEKVGGAVHLFGITFYDKDGKVISNPAQYGNIKYIEYTMNTPTDFADGGTYTQKIKLYNKVSSQDVLAKTVTVSVTKKMPTEFKGNFGIKIGQEYAANTIRPFMTPTVDTGWEVKTAPATAGEAELTDIFNGLDATDVEYRFDFGDGITDVNKDNDYVLTAASKYINDAKRELNVYCVYKDISAKKNNAGVWVKGDHEVAYSKTLYAQLASWEDDMTYGWGTITNTWGQDLPYECKLTWSSQDETKYTVELSKIDVDNKRDPETFGGTLATLMDNSGNNYLDYVASSARLVASDGSVNPYFKVEVSESSQVITFTQITTDAAQAPYQSHEETLEFKVKDVYGHVKTISLPVTVSKPVSE